MQPVPCTYEDGRRIWLVDTPGFDDTHRIVETLREVANWLNTAYKMKIKLTGIVYLHRILDARVGGAGIRNLRIFEKLCGDDGLGSVVLATTMWDCIINEEIENQREAELKTSPIFWKHMLDQGSTVFRQDKGRKSAMGIVRYLVEKRRPVTLNIQREMVDKNLQLGQTGAGTEVATEVEKIRQFYEATLKQAQNELQEALAAKDNKRKEELEEYKSTIEKRLADNQEELRKMDIPGPPDIRKMAVRSNPNLEGTPQLKRQRTSDPGLERAPNQPFSHQVNAPCESPYSLSANNSQVLKPIHGSTCGLFDDTTPEQYPTNLYVIHRPLYRSTK